MDKKADGIIIEIPNSNTVVIKPKDQHTLSLGDKIEVYEPGHDIIDPETNEVLDRYDFTKDILEVYSMTEKLAICKKISRRSGNKLTVAVTPFLTEKTYFDYEIIDVDEAHNKNWHIKNPQISIGDPVRLSSVSVD